MTKFAAVALCAALVAPVFADAAKTPAAPKMASHKMAGKMTKHHKMAGKMTMGHKKMAGKMGAGKMAAPKKMVAAPKKTS